MLVNVRMLLAGSVLLGYAVLTGRQRPSLRTMWKPFVVLGALNSVLPLTLEAMAVIQLNASLVAVLATTTPLFTALAAAVWLHERVPLARGAGLLLGFTGVGLLVGWSPVALTVTTLLAIGAALLSSFLYAVAGVYATRTFQGTSALSLAIGQELAAGLLLLPIALATPPTTMPTMPVLAATLSLALIMTAGGNLLYYYLLTHVGPTKTQSVSFLVPVFALLAGAVLLDEAVTASMLGGLGVIVLSVVLVTAPQLPWRPAAATQRAWKTIWMRKRTANRVGREPAGSALRAFRQTQSIPGHARVAIPVLYNRHSTPRLGAQHSPAPC